MAVMDRRTLFKIATASVAGVGMSGAFPQLAHALAKNPKRKRHCILLWMPGGPSQMDTFDMKPKHANGGQFKEIATSVPGLKISEHLPRLAKLANHLAILRGMSTAEGDHNRGTYLMHTGHRPGGPISYPTFGSSVSKALAKGEQSELPGFVSISPYTAFNNAAFGPGFLGPSYAPLTVGASTVFTRPRNGNYQLGVDDLKNPEIPDRRSGKRMELWKMLQTGFLDKHKSASPIAHNTVYERAVRMMNSESVKAFDLSDESSDTRQKYGNTRFGLGCLMARRLIEKGVPFVEISLRGSAQGAFGWDTHGQNFNRVKTLSGELDQGWAGLLQDLKDRGLLESTTIVWLGEFGRTPKINRNGGRDHYPKAWTTVISGGGIRGGQAYGKTSPDGTTVVEGKTDVGDLFATVCRAVGVDPATQNISEVGRPIRIAEGKAIESVIA